MRTERGKFAGLPGAVLFGLLLAPAVVHARTCEVAMWLDDSVTIGALQFDVGYSAVAGSFTMGPNGLACSGDAAGALIISGNDPSSRVLTTSILSLSGVTGPRKLAHCFFEDAHGTANSGDFDVVVTDATSPSGKALATPKVSVLLPNCGDETTTTTTSTTSSTTTSTSTSTSTSTTSTTLSDCGNGVVDDDEQCDDGNVEPDDGCEPDCTADIVCGDANGNDTVQSSDALLVLRAAVGQSVTCPVEVCDTDNDSVLRTSDSLRVLKRAVGQSVVMTCPPAENGV